MPGFLFDNPKPGRAKGALALYITGSLPTGKPGDAYEGRLQIHNAIGACQVRQIDGDTLPRGSSITVDQATQEIVVAWPAYMPDDMPIVNGNFEAGDIGWLKGDGWTIENTGGGNDGFGSKVAVYRGYGESFLEGSTFYPVTPGQTFTGQGNVQQGASDARAVGAGIGVRYYDAGRNTLTFQPGVFIDSGSHGQWHFSTGTFTAPSGAAYVRPAVRAARNRQNKPLWFDDFSWSLTGGGVGINVDATFNLTLQVTDSAGRSAIWTGVLRIRDAATWDLTWANRSPPNGVNSCVWAPSFGKWIVLGTDNKIYSSTDGVVFTYVRDNPTSGATQPNILSYANGRVYIGGNPMYYTTDGVTWVAAANTYVVTRLVYTGHGEYIGQWQGNGSGVFVSTDGINFTVRDTGIFHLAGTDIRVMDNVVLIFMPSGSNGGKVLRSVDYGHTFVTVALPNNGNVSMAAVDVDRGMVVAVGPSLSDGGLGYLSTNSGATFTAVASDFPSGNNWEAVAFAREAGMFVVIHQSGGKYAYSIDGSTWGVGPFSSQIPGSARRAMAWSPEKLQIVLGTDSAVCVAQFVY